MTEQLSVIVVNYSTPELLLNFLYSVRNSADSALVHDVIIVDNGYPEKGDSREVIDTSSFAFKIKFVQNPESSYASGANRGATVALGKFLIIANSDIELLPNSSIQPLINYLQREPRVGVVGPQLVYPDGTWQRSYERFPSFKEALISLAMLDSLWHGIMMWASRKNWWPKHPKMVDYIDGAFMVVRRSCFEEVGGFNEDYSFYGEDADFCWRARRAGWKVVFSPSVQVMHIRGASSTADALGDYTVRLFKAKQKFISKHFGPRRAWWYGQISKLALRERAVFYSLVAKFRRSQKWQQRKAHAKARWSAVRMMK